MKPSSPDLPALPASPIPPESPCLPASPQLPASPSLDRRALLIGGSVAAGGLLAGGLARQALRPRAATFIARQPSYDGDLARTIRDGLLATGLRPERLRGKRVLLKPNLVEPSRHAPHMTTHPAVLLATAEVFRGWSADVVVGEAPANIRDTEITLSETGTLEALDQAGLPFADLNYEPSRWVPNRGRASTLKGLYFPQSILEADLVVSLPKLKTHHWAGMTCSMKNLYGTLPGLRYGWPKNVLHYAGIPQSVHDIAASLPKTITVVDAIDCMEGDGPILGTRKNLGLLLIGTNLAAVDATACRLMHLNPHRVGYLALAADRLGPLDEARIEQRGEAIRPVAQPFHVIDAPHLAGLRQAPA